MNTDKLLILLNKALKKVENLEKHTIIEVEDGTNLKCFLANIMKNIEDNSATIDDKYNLWAIFAPSSLWDDNFTDIDFSNMVFKEIEKLYYKEIMLEKFEKSPL